MAEWRVYVYECDGNGNITLVDGDVRASAQPTRELNAPGALSLTVKPEQDVSLRPWRSLIVVELDGSIRGTGIVSDMADDGDGALSVTCVGVTGYYDTEPYDVVRAYKNQDPARVMRDASCGRRTVRATNSALTSHRIRIRGFVLVIPTRP